MTFIRLLRTHLKSAIMGRVDVNLQKDYGVGNQE